MNKNAKETKEGKPSTARLDSVMRNEREVLGFQAKDEGENACFPWKWAIGKKIVVVDVRMFFVIQVNGA